jgi:hypothetical protein
LIPLFVVVTSLVFYAARRSITARPSTPNFGARKFDIMNLHMRVSLTSFVVLISYNGTLQSIYGGFLITQGAIRNFRSIEERGLLTCRPNNLMCTESQKSRFIKPEFRAVGATTCVFIINISLNRALQIDSTRQCLNTRVRFTQNQQK